MAHAASVRFASNNGMNLFATTDTIQAKVKTLTPTLSPRLTLTLTLSPIPGEDILGAAYVCK